MSPEKARNTASSGTLGHGLNSPPNGDSWKHSPGMLPKGAGTSRPTPSQGSPFGSDRDLRRQGGSPGSCILEAQLAQIQAEGSMQLRAESPTGGRSPSWRLRKIGREVAEENLRLRMEGDDARGFRSPQRVQDHHCGELSSRPPRAPLLYPPPTVLKRSPSPTGRNAPRSPGQSPRRSTSPTTKALRDQWAELRSRVSSPMRGLPASNASPMRSPVATTRVLDRPASSNRSPMKSSSRQSSYGPPQLMIKKVAETRSPKPRLPPRCAPVPATSGSTHDLKAGLSVATSAASTTDSMKDLLGAGLCGTESSNASTKDLHQASPMPSPALSYRSSGNLVIKEDTADALARVRLAARPPTKKTLGKPHCGGA